MGDYYRLGRLCPFLTRLGRICLSRNGQILPSHPYPEMSSRQRGRGPPGAWRHAVAHAPCVQQVGREGSKLIGGGTWGALRGGAGKGAIKKRTAPSVPKWSPTSVLTGPD